MSLLNAITTESRGEEFIELGDGRWGQMEEMPINACPKSDWIVSQWRSRPQKLI